MAIHPAWLSILTLCATLGIAAPLLSNEAVKQGLERVQTGNIPIVEAVNIDGTPYLMVVVSAPKKNSRLLGSRSATIRAKS